MRWIIRDPKRLVREREEIENLSGEVDWITAVHWHLDNETLALTADLDITIHGIVREIDLTYPDGFPDTPAYIRPRDRSQRCAHPAAGPNPLAVRNSILGHLATLPPAPYINATRYDVGDEEPIVADDSDVSQIASTLTRMALDTLLESHPSAFPHPAYLIGFRKEWIFSGAFDTQPIDVTGQGWEAQAATDEERQVALVMLVKLLSEETDDYADPALPSPGHDQSGAA